MLPPWSQQPLAGQPCPQVPRHLAAAFGQLLPFWPQPQLLFGPPPKPPPSPAPATPGWGVVPGPGGVPVPPPPGPGPGITTGGRGPGGGVTIGGGVTFGSSGPRPK